MLYKPSILGENADLPIYEMSSSNWRGTPGAYAKEDTAMPELFRKILSPVYFDETSQEALEYARHFAQHNDGSVSLLHVVPTDEFHLLRRVYEPEKGGGADPDWAEKISREKLQALAQEHLNETQHEILTRLNSDPAAGILEVQKDIGADLVVMATHGRTGLSHLILGSVAEKVVRETSGPVFISRHDEHLSETQPFQKILVPVDITEQSGPALSYARQIAEQYGATVYPLHVVPAADSDLLLREVYRAGPQAPADHVYAEKVAQQKLEELAQTYLGGVQTQIELHVSDDPGRTIIEMEKAIGADLLVMATHGFSGMFHLLLRSITEKMMREAGCPVLALHQ
jgi:nucleotide-binding universal stress UspA family protein